ncbi:MAG: toxin HicA [Alcaligenaceae bacterium]|nr:toxin HicA [Alcaligenaceae bacterium]
MSASNKILEHMRISPNNVRFDDLLKVCETYFERKLMSDDKTKAYQVKQVLAVIDKLNSLN